ncbi:hypothetical protein TWF481_000327 [Arthrobotrys musiformis]|uniref:Uncharacterized protein n=1 Tax=Arthrobotrys musiformis TaxID=47236 RepID=A0AAV9WT26_9PEZI
MRPLRFSGCVGLWVSMQALILQVMNHVPMATAVVVEIPLAPDLKDYFLLNWKAFVNIGHQTDKLRAIKDQKCPTGDQLDPSTAKVISKDMFSSTLSYLIRKLRLAEDQLNQAIKLMQDYYLSDPSKLEKLLSDYGFQDITGAEEARDRLVQYREIFFENLQSFGRLSAWLDKWPGEKYPSANDATKNLMKLSWRIEGATKDNLSQENKLQVDTDVRAHTLKAFQDSRTLVTESEELAHSAMVWAKENLTYPFKQYAHNDFTVAMVFKRMQTWFRCWEPPLSTIANEIANKLGPFPIWERED